jgi:hypothetical protein
MNPPKMLRSHYSEEELLETFMGVADASDWRKPVKAIIPIRMFGEVATAVEFFTATRLEIVELLPEQMVRVHADGFSAGPAASMPPKIGK